MLIAALGTARRWIGLAAFPGIAALLNGAFGVWALFLVLLAAGLLAVLSAVWGLLEWRATTYRVSGGAFHFKRGVLQKSERSLPLDRVQSVDTVQGIVQRLFGVVEVRVEAAGEAESRRYRCPPSPGMPPVPFARSSRARARLLWIPSRRRRRRCFADSRSGISSWRG